MGDGLKHKFTHCPLPIAYSPANYFHALGCPPRAWGFSTKMAMKSPSPHPSPPGGARGPREQPKTLSLHDLQEYRVLRLRGCDDLNVTRRV